MVRGISESNIQRGGDCHKEPANQCKETGIACQTTSLPAHRAKERRTQNKKQRNAAAAQRGRIIEFSTPPGSHMIEIAPPATPFPLQLS